MQTILVCDDDRQIVEAIEIYLNGEGYRILKAYDGQEALDLLKDNEVNLMILDVMMPGLDGLRTTMKVRETSSIPIIILSAKSEDTDKILGLNIGADDYITKPFSVEELLARLRVTFRRLNYLENLAGKESSIYVNAGLKIDYAAHTVFLNEDELHLTQTEYRLLCLLAKNTGKVLTYKYITQNIWGSSWETNMATLRVVVTTLRRKLSSQESEPMIQTHVGIGYRMVKL